MNIWTKNWQKNKKNVFFGLSMSETVLWKNKKRYFWNLRPEIHKKVDEKSVLKKKVKIWKLVLYDVHCAVCSEMNNTMKDEEEYNLNQ